MYERDFFESYQTLILSYIDDMLKLFFKQVKMSSKTGTIILGVVVLIIGVVIGILYFLGYIHFGKQTQATVKAWIVKNKFTDGGLTLSYDTAGVIPTLKLGATGKQVSVVYTPSTLTTEVSAELKNSTTSFTDTAEFKIVESTVPALTSLYKPGTTGLTANTLAITYSQIGGEAITAAKAVMVAGSTSATYSADSNDITLAP